MVLPSVGPEPRVGEGEGGWRGSSRSWPSPAPRAAEHEAPLYGNFLRSPCPVTLGIPKGSCFLLPLCSARAQNRSSIRGQPDGRTEGQAGHLPLSVAALQPRSSPWDPCVPAPPWRPPPATSLERPPTPGTGCHWTQWSRWDVPPHPVHAPPLPHDSLCHMPWWNLHRGVHVSLRSEAAILPP